MKRFFCRVLRFLVVFVAVVVIVVLFFSLRVFAAESHFAKTTADLRLRNDVLGDIILTMPKESVVEVLEEFDNGWARVNFSNKIGYCSLTYLDSTDAEEITLYTMSMVSANLREKASLKSKVIALVSKGQMAKVLSIDKEWMKISYYDSKGKVNRIGYVHKSNFFIEGEKEEVTDDAELLSEYTTYYANSGANRKFNMAHASSLINGYVIKPEETFSFNGTVNNSMTMSGYKVAGVLVNGRPAQGVGGGICQVSSTLYAATVALELEKTERYPHSAAVGYIPRDLEASVNYSSADFRFKNNKEYSILIVIKTTDTSITVQLYKK